ncbi:MAG: ATP-binding protein [Sphaerochaetaceae bacterium]|nr:ATP-binding protein [Sphaerochaetaceae bacterium]
MVEREFPASDEVLGDVTAFVEEELGKVGCPPAQITKISIILEEIFVHISHYAYHGEEGKMKLCVDAAESSVKMIFSDRGVPFNPLEKKDPDITLSAEERGIGGLGIFMVKKAMDKVSYNYVDGCNVLTVEKKFC